MVYRVDFEDENEDPVDYMLAVAAWQEYKKSDGKTYSSDELCKEYGL